ncbi:MAG: GAF domain-containing protein [Acidobacteria bacterium]|nr:GAF domain-containing protein [Acidobacteriota bacterium]MCI0719986.1 GAF domain-containing protein [Acidobacteriota bacterium]
MNRLPPVTRHAPWLLGASLLLPGCLIVGLIGLYFRHRQSGAEPGSEGPRVPALLAQQAQSVTTLMTSELERVRQQVRATAELTTHIFTNPESYRLAAQPGEYDYDPATGLYGSVRNDGASAVLLSTVSTLNPEILRDIRLSEYLNPVLKASLNLNPVCREAALYTTDGLVRSYPWFDFKGRIASGALRRNFSVIDLPFFAKAMPSRNPSKEAVCELVNGNLRGGEMQLTCAAPFFAGDNFRGVVAIGVDASRLAAKLFRNLEPREAFGLLVGSGDRVLGTSRNLEGSAKAGGPPPAGLKDLKVPGISGLEPLLRQLASAERYFGKQAGLYVAVAPAAGLPGKLVLLLPEAHAAWHNSVAAESALPRWLLIGVVLACGLLLADAWWIAETRRSVQNSEKKLIESFNALSDLNLESALIATPQGLLSVSDLYPKFNEGLQSVQKALEASRQAGPLPEAVAAATDSLSRDLKQIQHEAAVLCSFDAADSAEHNVTRLAIALSSIFEVQEVSFFSHAESTLRTPLLRAGKPAQEPRMASIEWKKGMLFDTLTRSQRVVWSNALDLSPEEQQLLAPLIQRNYLAAPLLDEGRLVGAVVLSDKPSDFSAEDEALLASLLALLCKTLQNAYQCDALSKVNLLRREYCLELAKAVEAPLDRIRAEVQSIYARLGKLTPYYKQHCETILFEVGKLYEMVREAREAESAAEAKPAEPVASSES